MVFSYYDNGAIKKLNLEIGKNWKDYSNNDAFLNSIFNKVDDNDGIISGNELFLLERLFQKFNIKGQDEVLDEQEKENFLNFIDQTKREDLFKEIKPDSLAFIISCRMFGESSEKYSDFINGINSDNVLEVLKSFPQKSGGQGLIRALIGNGMTAEDQGYVMHIKTAIMEHFSQKGVYVDDISTQFDKELNSRCDIKFLNSLVNKLNKRLRRLDKQGENIKPNGEIDGNFKQGSVGNCWLLASIIAINRNPLGKDILKNSIKVNDDGSVTVSLKGVNKSYTISKEELEGSTEYSTGDLDVRALEIAFDRYFYEKGEVNTSKDTNGNYSFVAYEILTGETSNILRQDVNDDTGERAHSEVEINDAIINNFTTENSVVTVSSNKKDIELFGCVKNEHTGKLEIVKLLSNHAYAVIGADENNVYLINPHDSSETVAVSRNDFKKFFNRCAGMILEGNDELLSWFNSSIKEALLF